MGAGGDRGGLLTTARVVFANPRAFLLNVPKSLQNNPCVHDGSASPRSRPNAGARFFLCSDTEGKKSGLFCFKIGFGDKYVGDK